MAMIRRGIGSEMGTTVKIHKKSTCEKASKLCEESHKDSSDRTASSHHYL